MKTMRFKAEYSKDKFVLDTRKFRMDLSNFKIKVKVAK